MRIICTIEDQSVGPRRDLVIDADADASLSQLLDALQGSWRGGAVTVNGATLNSSSRLGDVLVDGVVISLDPAPNGSTRSEPPATFSGLEDGIELRIVGGPDAGRTWRLPAGSYVVGRGDDAQVHLGEDEQVSRFHAVIEVGGGEVKIIDHGSANGVLLRGAPVLESTVSEGETLQLGETIVSWSRPARRPTIVATERPGERLFSRPPRIVPEPTQVKIALPGEVPSRPTNPLPMVGIVAPVIVGVAMAVLTKRPEYLLFTVLSPVAAIGTHVSDRRRGAHSRRALEAERDAAQRRAEVTVAEAVHRELREAREATPDPAAILEIASVPRERLWERRRSNEDFLVLRLGLIDRPASITFEQPGGGETSIEVPVLRQVPATIALASIGVLGIAGPRASGVALTRWLAGQAATLHAPTDLDLAVITSNDGEAEWSWAKWLPHVRPDGGEYLARIATTPSSINRLTGELANLVDARLEAASSSSGTAHREEKPVLVIIDGANAASSKPTVAKILSRGHEVGVFSICLDATGELLPEECRATVVFPSKEATRCSLRTSREAPIADVLGDLVTSEWCERLGRSLAPLRLNRRVDAAAALPDALRLVDLLGLSSVTSDGIVERWKQSGRTTAAVVGATVGDDLVIDLSRDGPHGLVAGTTGSGKSEFLQSLIASLAVANRPDAMSFVLVDYKGGSAFKECSRLPHTVGMVTDLDGHLTERALASLGAELRRRERLFQVVGAKDIDDYWRAPRQVSLARLVMVIDEFASLVEELPNFVDGLVDLARRGRSLGIHLLLATQRPSGVVSPAIRTNTSLRVAMRVTDAADSSDVIDSPLASRISVGTPGRGYVRSGHEQLTEFQAARVGGRRQLAASGAGVKVREFRWEELADPRLLARSELATEEVTDLAVIVEAVEEATTALGIAVAPSPWLPALPNELVLSSLDAVPGELVVPFGAEDWPSEQARRTASYDLADGGHLLIVGDPGSGRSTFLRTFGASMASCCSAEDVHLFGIECGSGALTPFAELPQCGAVVSRGEPDRVDRLFAKLGAEVLRRQQLFARSGFSTLADQRAAANDEQRLPYLVVLLDRWEGFLATFENVDGGRLVQNLLQLMRESSSVGVRFVIAGDRSALSGRLTQLVEAVFLMRLNDRSGYGLAGLHARSLPVEFPSGRAVRSGSGVEVQVALIDGEPTGPGQAAALRAVVERCVERDLLVEESKLPDPIGVLPSYVARSTLSLASAAVGGTGLLALVGVGGDRLNPLYVDLTKSGPGFVIGGPPGSGRSSALLVIAMSLLEGGARLALVTTRPSPLQGLASMAGVVASIDGRAAPDPQFVELLAGERLVVVVDDAELANEGPVAEALVTFLRSARDHANALVAGGTTAEMAGTFRGVIAEAKKSHNGLLLAPSAVNDGDLLGVRLPRTSLFSGPPGRGVLVTEGAQVIVQVPADDAP